MHCYFAWKSLYWGLFAPQWQDKWQTSFFSNKRDMFCCLVCCPFACWYTPLLLVIGGAALLLSDGCAELVAVGVAFLVAGLGFAAVWTWRKLPLLTGAEVLEPPWPDVGQRPPVPDGAPPGSASRVWVHEFEHLPPAPIQPWPGGVSWPAANKAKLALEAERRRRRRRRRRSSMNNVTPR